MKLLATAFIAILSLTAFSQPPDSTSLDSLMGETDEKIEIRSNYYSQYRVMCDTDSFVVGAVKYAEVITKYKDLGLNKTSFKKLEFH